MSPTVRDPLPPVVRRFGIVSFLNDLASEMVYPLLPMLITVRLGGGAIALGALDGIAEAVASGVKLLGGRLADRPGWRAPLIIGGYALAAVLRPVIGLASAAWHVIALRAGDRLGKGARTPARDAVIADAAGPRTRGRAFGFQRALDHAGAVAGPLVAWILMGTAGLAVTQVIVASAVPGLVAVGIVAWALYSERDHPSGTPSDHGPDPAAEHRPASPFLLVLIVLFNFARFPEALFLLRLQDLGVQVALIPLVWAALHVIRSAGGWAGGWLSDHLGVRHTLLLGWIMYALVAAGLALSRSPLLGSLVFLGFGISTSLTEAPERAFVAASGVAKRGSRFGVYHASVGLAALASGLTFGVVYAGVSGEAALGVSATLAVAVGGAATLRGGHGFRVS